MDALSAYEAYAAVYDELNHRNDYEMWLGRHLLPELERRGLRKGRVLDVACGTGRAFPPLLERGWQVQGCDISPAMLGRARQKFGTDVGLEVADMRELPTFGAFELVLALNDALNHLLGLDELERALRGIGSNLRSDGLLLFDCNSLLAYGLAYEGEETVVEKDGRRWTWKGLGRDEAMPVYRAQIEGDDLEEPVLSVERYFRISEVKAAMAAAGLRVLAALGQREVGGEVVLSEDPDDRADHKIVYIGARQ